ncbi:Hypothetical predicted protein [Cloeon dipterum]|uniref:EB domain-containing protein n=1 Tax=Cloeon dipterum TaxID=197152 RepID=A0A8S1C763_9INSE|nr:Hypothetical predicted protein [Cloeon dipterum]
MNKNSLVRGRFHAYSSFIKQIILSVRRMTSTLCSTTAECTENAECSRPHGVCFCRRNFVFFEDLCLPVAEKIGDACTADIQCQYSFGADSECFNASDSETGKCRCKINSHFAEGKCHISRLLGDRCVSRSDCYLRGGGSVYCVSGVCICHQDYHPNEARDQCLRSIELGSPCASDEECIANSAKCYGECSCPAAAVPAPDRRRCLPVAHELNDSCEVDAQCLQFLPLTECKQAECTCSPGTHRMDDKCWRTKNLNAVCEDSRECGLSGTMICSSNARCRCAPDHHPKDKFGCVPNSASAGTSAASLLLYLISGLILFILANYS